MSKYREENINGSKWTRCNRIEISNPYFGSKRAVFYEEEAIQFSNTDIQFKQSSSILKPLQDEFDSNTVIEIYNPITLQPTGNTFTHADLYTMLFSVYMHKALERDNLE